MCLNHRWRQGACRCPGVYSQGRYAQRTGAGRLQVKERPAGAASRTVEAIEMLLDRGFSRSPQQLDIAHSVSSRPLESLSDGALWLVVENARQLEEGSGVVINGDGQVVTE